jgi:hypothetical protein
MVERAAEKAFRQYKKKIIAVMGRKATTDVQISNMGVKLFGKRFIGVFAKTPSPSARPVC